MEIFSAFALNKCNITQLVEQCLHSHYIGFAEYLKGGYKISVRCLAFIPPAKSATEGCSNVYFIHRGIELNVWIALRKCRCIISKVLRPLGVLERFYPIRNTKMA